MPRSIAEIRKANGGLANLTDEDILQSTFKTYKSYYPSLDEYAADVGYSGAGRGLAGSRISAGIDQYQANLLGLGGAVARTVGAEDTAAAFDARRVANESAAAYAAQRARDLGGIEDWRDVTGVGTGLNFVGGLAAQSLPYLGEAVAGGLTGGLALGSTAARMGLTRAAASTAGAVGASYPSAVGDVLSAQREAGGENLGAAALGGVPYAALNALGIEGQLARGMRPLIQGEGGLARRLAVAVPTTAVAEGLSETGQELINQYAGRMAIDPNETLFNEAANKRYLDSFIGGAALGGVFGGVGGLRSERPEQGAIDLTQPDTPAPLGKSITGTDPSALMGNPLAGANLLGGGYPAGLTAFGNAAQPTTPSLMSQETDLTAPAGATATTPLAAGTPAATTPAPSKLFSEDEQKLLSFGITPSGKTLAILPMILEAKLTEEQLDSVRTTLAQNKYKQAEKIIKQAAAQNIINAMSASTQGATDASTGISTVQQPAGGVGVGGAIVPGTVGAAGSATPITGAVGGGAATTGTPLQQAGVLPDAGGQPSTAVTEQSADLTAAAPAVTEPDILTQIFGEQDAGIVRDFLMGKSSAKIAAELKEAGVQGRGEQMIRNKIAGERAVREEWPKKIAAAKAKYGYTDEQIQQALRDSMAPDADTRSEVEREMNLGRADLYGVRMSETEAIEAGLEGSVKSAGGGSAAVKGFTKLQKDIDAMYKRLETEKDPLVLAYISNRLQQLQKQVEVFEDKEQARIRATAGLGDADGEVDLVAAAQEAEPESSSISDADTAKKAAAEKLRAESAAKRSADRKGLEVGDTVMNPKLGTGVVKGFSGDGDATIVTVDFQSGQTKELSVKMAKLEKTNAVQVQSAAGVPVQPETQTGQGVGKQVRSTEKPAGQGEVLTEREQAAQAWDKVASGYPTAPKFADLTKAQQQDFIGFGPDNWTEDDVNTELTKLAKAGLKFGTESAPASQPYTAKQLISEIKAFIRTDILGRKLTVVDSVEELLSSPDKATRAVGAAIKLQGAYGVAVDGRAFLVANRIKQGQGRAKFMHEVGGHLGLDNLLTKAQFDKLVDQIKTWARQTEGSLETELALQAFERVQAAGTPKEDQRSELIAYFIESAMQMGIDPTGATDAKLSSPLREWFRTLWAAFKIAVRKLGMKPETMTAQDVVNLAYGAARLEMNGVWHGTAATFRNFRNQFIGTGEGATAYGWGTYLAQRVGIAKGYWKQDVQRKTNDNYFVNGKPVEPGSVEAFAAATLRGLQARGMSLEAIQQHYERQIVDPAYAKRPEVVEGLKKTVEYAKSRAVITGGIPEGSLMRVDTAVEDSRMFDYDKPVIRQSNYIADKLMGLLDPVTDEVVDRTNKDVEELTGRDLIGTGENDLGLLSLLIMDDAISPAKPDAQFDKAVRQGKYHEAASHLLRTLGIDGIKFFDAQSRGTATQTISYDGKRYNRDQLRDMSRDAYKSQDAAEISKFTMLRHILRNGLDVTKAELEQKIANQLESTTEVYQDSAKRYGITESLEESRARAEKSVAQGYEAKQLEWLNANEKKISFEESPKTQNLIIFDDKNVQRVGSEINASPQRMKFGKNAPTAGVIQSNIAKLPKASQSPVRTIVRALGDLTGSGLDYVVFTSDLIKRAVDAGLTSAQTFADALSQRRARVSELEREIERIADGYADIEPEFKGAGRGSVNDFLFESTRTLKWGYDSGKLKADPEMAIAFNKLGPKAQQFVKNVFAHGDKILSQKKQVVLNSANTEYDAMIQAAQDAVNAAQVAVNTATDAKLKIEAEAELDKRKTELAALKAEKVATLKRFQTLFAIREGKPYAPIKRDGAWVVIGKSAEYKAAEAANDMALKKKLESDADHYHVSFVDTKWQARTLSDKLSEQGVFTQPDIVKRADAFEEAFSGEALLPALTKIRSAVDKRDDSDRSKMLNIVNQLYLEALAEGSARKSEMRRRGVAGEVDMLQSFTRQGRADANFLASVEFEPRIQDALQQMRNDRRGGDRTRKTEIFDELTKRYTDSLDPKGNAFISGLTNTASKYFLASSPAYYLQNLTQPFMMSLPALAGRHEYTKASKALFDAYAELGPLFKDVKLFDQQFDFSKVPADVRAAIKELVNQGQIDIGLATEINEYKVDADSNLGKFAQRLNKSMRLAVQKVEATNRLSTAIAAYRLEFERAKKDPKIADPQAAATQYAAGILEDTHGDYTSMNAPRIFNSQWGQIALQFRKFQLIQIAFYAKLLRDAFTNPAERAVAMRTLAFSLGHSAVFAGMMGLPGYAAIAAILKAFSDDDEPYDLTAEMRKAIGPEWADMIMRGAPTLVGVDLSGKIGSGNMLSIIPFSDADLSTTAGRAEAFGTLVGGASLGMTSRVADGMGLILSGDYYKGIERTMPKGVSDALKAGRQAAEGMTRRNGDVVLPAEEISAISAILTGLGVPSVKEAVVYERQNRMRDITQNFQERTTRIKNDYVRANKDNDAAAKQSAREAWMKLQKVRQENGLKVQPLSDLLKAPQEQAKRERMTVGGVQYTKATRKLAEEIAEE